MMKILVVNDDGIASTGIASLARWAGEFGSVTVAAPSRQCSGMSQRISLEGGYSVCPRPFPVEGVAAYAVDGTPVDCVRAALGYILPEKPDIVFSGINQGYNLGQDIAYSGTAGAALEALLCGVPAIAFSKAFAAGYDVVDANIQGIIRELLAADISDSEVWNVNFPGCTAAELRGILRDRKVQRRVGHCRGALACETRPEGVLLRQTLIGEGELDVGALDVDSDMYAVYNNYISIGKIRSGVLC